MKKVDREALLVKVADEVEAALDRAASQEDRKHEGPARRVWNVPERNFYFTGREDLLKALHQALQTRRRAMLSGLGGVGKTQTAVEYA